MAIEQRADSCWRFFFEPRQQLRNVDVLPVECGPGPLPSRSERQLTAPRGRSAKRTHVESSGVETLMIDVDGRVDCHSREPLPGEVLGSERDVGARIRNGACRARPKRHAAKRAFAECEPC